MGKPTDLFVLGQHSVDMVEYCPDKGQDDD
jgi:hypothetical protein